MNTFTLHHIAIATWDLEKTLKDYEKRLFFQSSKREKLEKDGVEAVLVHSGSACLELISPLSKTNSIARFLEKRGEGLHHVCYQVEDLDKELTRLTSEGVELIDKTPRRGLGGKRIAFAHPKSFHGVLTEFCEIPL